MSNFKMTLSHVTVTVALKMAQSPVDKSEIAALLATKGFKSNVAC